MDRRSKGAAAPVLGRKGRPRQFDTDTALAAALELFWRRGYGGTSMSELTGAMALSRSSLYASFGSKHDVLMAALERYVAHCLDDLARLAATVSDPAEALRRMLFRIAEPDGGDKGCFLVNSITELAPDDDAVLALSRDVNGRVERLFADTLCRGLPSTPDGRRLARARAAALLSSAQGATLMRKSGASSRKVREMLAALDPLLGG